MRITLDIANDVLQAAEELARRENKTVDEVFSELARKALAAPPVAPTAAQEAAPSDNRRRFPMRGNRLNDLLDKLVEEDAH